ncbi:large subunit ribosomal protein L18 protein, partial [Dioscorea alata]
MIPSIGNQHEKFDIELMDPDLWRVSFGLSHSMEGIVRKGEDFCSSVGDDDGSGDCSTVMDNCPDFDEIDDLRLRKKLFYKLDRGSKEFEEYSFDFHRKIPSSARKEGKKSEKQSLKVSSSQVNKLVNAEKIERNTGESSGVGGMAKFIEGKKLRTPTFNQLTDPYHLPFCLDILVTKGSVRACVVHRATSKVVVVAHSISKDMKFDVASRKGVKACFAVGKILAQRAMEEDIYNVVYTPRKGDKIEGKLQIVLQSIIDSGIDVKLKQKQKQKK